MPLFSFNPNMNIKKAIIIGTLLAIGATLTTCAITNYDRNNKISETHADVLETLQNTTWYFNERLNNLPLNEEQLRPQYNINFKANLDDTQYNTIKTQRTSVLETLQFYADQNTYTNAYNYTEQYWENEEYRIIKITNGTDVTNTNLINWFKNNAIKIETTTLKRTTWQLKETLEYIPAGYGKFTFSIHKNGYVYSGLELGYSSAVQTQRNTIRIAGEIIYQNGQYLAHSRQNRFFIIDDGQDVTNIKIIAWLTRNAIKYNTFDNLTNTKWVFDQTPYFNGAFNMQLEFTSNRKQFLNIKSGTPKTTILYTEYKGLNNPNEDIKVHESSMWINESYKTIIVSGGNSATSLDTQSRLISNATNQQFTPIPDSNNGYDIEDGNFTSLQNLILKILTLPFTFISQAFNVTLWPNTAWEFNISNFILAIIAIGAVLFIIKVFTSGFSVIGNYTYHRNQNRLTKSQIAKNKSETKLNKAKTDNEKKKQE